MFESEEDFVGGGVFFVFEGFEFFFGEVVLDEGDGFDEEGSGEFFGLLGEVGEVFEVEEVYELFEGGGVWTAFV